MSDIQAKVIPEFKLLYRHLNAEGWYDVAPVFPGVTLRRTDIFGERLTRLRTGRGYETFRAAHFEFRARPAEEEQGRTGRRRHRVSA